MSLFSAFGKFFSKVFRAFADLFKSEAMKFAVKYKDLAVPIILELAASAMSGPEKRNAAFRRIAKQLTDDGVYFGKHMIYLLIEMVYAELKVQGRIG